MRRSTHQLLLSLSQLQGVVDDKDHRDAKIEQGEQCVYPQHTSTNGRGGVEKLQMYPQDASTNRGGGGREKLQMYPQDASTNRGGGGRETTNVPTGCQH